LPAGAEDLPRRVTASGPHVPRAVLLDVDFTLLRPGVLFSAAGYRATGARFGLRLDVDRWHEAERRAFAAVKARRDGRGNAHDDEVYEIIAEAIVTAMGGDDPARVDRCAAAIVDAWGRCENFSLYDDVRPCLVRLRAAGLVVGLVSNTSRDLDEVLETFDLGDLVDGAVTSSQVGLFKPAPEIFAAALACVGAAAGETVMVGDSYGDDVAGALAAGLAGAVLLDRTGRQADRPGRAPLEAPVIDSLEELPALLGLG
jgi:putative hydrolase of the HAD superfamily